jgi:hypothetical protein
MNEATAIPVQRPRRLRLDWIIPVLFRPRAALAEITGQLEGVWLTPLLLLTLSGLLVVAAAGPIRTAAAQQGVVELPDVAQFWTPEQQAAFMQTQQARSGPVFIYVFPALLTVLGVWFGWLVAAGLLHLVLTLLGGRVTSGSTVNLVAWASLPFVLRDLLQAGFMLVTKQLVPGAGLAGFAPAGEGMLNTVLAQVLQRVDLYSLWYALLLIIGVQTASGLRGGKATTGVVLTLAVLLLLAVLPAVIVAQLGSLGTLTPFLGF